MDIWVILKLDVQLWLLTFSKKNVRKNAWFFYESFYRCSSITNQLQFDTFIIFYYFFLSTKSEYIHKIVQSVTDNSVLAGVYSKVCVGLILYHLNSRSVPWTSKEAKRPKIFLFTEPDQIFIPNNKFLENVWLRQFS